MNRLLLILAEGGFLVWIVLGLFRKFRRAGAGSASLSDEKLLSYVERFGRNSNSFMTLYPGFEYFVSPSGIEGAIAFVDTTNAWVAAAEPLCAEENQLRLLEEFSQAARARKKRTLLVPADQAFARKAAAAGFGMVQVGGEPMFLLDRYPKSGTTWLDAVQTAKTLDSKGALVREFRPAELSEERRAMLDAMTDAWLKSRKTVPLGFVNQVKPWHREAQKKYFEVEVAGKIEAFLAAIPFKGGKGWYLIDTIREEGSHAGATELLLLQAMKKLREYGAEEITLGVAPLGGIESGIFHWIFENGSLFYGFKSLYQYKMKFEPSVLRPTYLLSRGVKERHRGLRLRDLVSLSQAWLPRGMLHASGLGTIRWVARMSLPDLIKSMLRPGTVVRSVPPNAWRLAIRCRLAILLLIAAPFLITNTLSLGLSLLGLVVFTGGLEYLAGTLLTGMCFVLPVLLALPLTHLPNLALGILGTAGGLYWFVMNGNVWLTLLAAGSLCYAFLLSAGSSHWIQMIYPAAVGVGLLAAKFRLRA